MPSILLTFDVEEFDLPLEYQCAIETAEQMDYGLKGLNAIKPVIQQPNMETTLFTTANFAQHFPTDIKTLAERHEIASHTFYHSLFKTEHLRQSKQALEDICEQEVIGLRMPFMKNINIKDVKEAGYRYDSSINPTWVPGRYNNRGFSRTLFKQNELLCLPASVTPGFRIPLFWLAFKNLPYRLFKTMALQTLKKDGYLNLYFHPWEFTDIHQLNIPGYIKKDSGEKMLKKLNQLITDFRNEGEFVSIKTHLQRIKEI